MKAVMDTVAWDGVWFCVFPSASLDEVFWNSNELSKRLSLPHCAWLVFKED
jgi:hypothetical protein